MSFPRRLQAVVFDLDGTLLDTAPEFAAAVAQLRGEHNLPPLPAAAVRAAVSDGARAMVTLALDMPPQHRDFERHRARFLQIYEQNLGSATAPFPCIAGLLAALEDGGIPWGVSTNKPSYLTLPLLRLLGLRPGSVVCPDHVAQPKPHPEPLLLNARQLDVDPARSVYVGDHQRDIDAGRAAGMVTIAAAYGYTHHPTEAGTWGADHVAESGEALAALLATLS